MRERLEGRRKVKNAEALEEPKRGHGCIEVQSGGESGTEREPERFDGVHAGPS